MSTIALINYASGSVATPAAGGLRAFSDLNLERLSQKDDAGRFWAQSHNASTASQGAGFSADTYLTDSDLLIPSWGFQTKTIFMWRVSASKTGAGTATPVYTIRTGSARTTGDTSRLALTGPAQTAIADIGTLYIMVTVRSTGASGVIQGTAWWVHRGTAASTTVSGVGFANDTTGHVEGTSAGFDMTGLAGLYIGISVNGGASASWTVTQVQAEAKW